ncbi:MAG: dihydrodipicolinate synthase family protein, partial [Actinomycetota bacterium]|nr:dihydrodipicolinate synthase family protein [Actinomycetota bacterium]
MPGSAPPPFTGVAVALVTLFDDDLAVDIGATAALAAQVVEAGVGTVVVAGTTGEAAALDAGERTALLDV